MLSTWSSLMMFTLITRLRESFVKFLHFKVSLAPISTVCFLERTHYVHLTLKGWELCSISSREWNLDKMTWNSSIWVFAFICLLSIYICGLIDIYFININWVIIQYSFFSSSFSFFFFFGCCSNCFSIDLSVGSRVPLTSLYFPPPAPPTEGHLCVFLASALESHISKKLWVFFFFLKNGLGNQDLVLGSSSYTLLSDGVLFILEFSLVLFVIFHFFLIKFIFSFKYVFTMIRALKKFVC